MLHVVDHGTPEAHDAAALDAALLAAAERGGAAETLRIWESRRTAIVVGWSGLIDREVDRRACVADGVPIVRRVSGGGAVVVGPGCLNYSLVLSLERRPELLDIRRSYEIVLGRLAAALGAPRPEIRGLSDLALGPRKISGNAQRRGKVTLLHHGTLLYDFDARAMHRYLKEPARRPAYRGCRTHGDFVTNLPHRVEQIKRALRAVSDLFGRDVFK